MTPIVLTRKLIEVCGGLNGERAVYFNDGTRIFVTPEEAEALEQHRGVEFRISLDPSKPSWRDVQEVVTLRDSEIGPKGIRGNVDCAGEKRMVVVFTSDSLPLAEHEFALSDWLDLIGPYAPPSDTTPAPPPTWPEFASAVYPVVEECPPTPRNHGQSSTDPDADVEPSLGDEPQ